MKMAETVSENLPSRSKEDPFSLQSWLGSSWGRKSLLSLTQFAPPANGKPGCKAQVSGYDRILRECRKTLFPLGSLLFATLLFNDVHC